MNLAIEPKNQKSGKEQQYCNYSGESHMLITHTREK